MFSAQPELEKNETVIKKPLDLTLSAKRSHASNEDDSGNLRRFVGDSFKLKLLSNSNPGKNSNGFRYTNGTPTPKARNYGKVGSGTKNVNEPSTF
ncbi:hypothetical protein Q3G72_001098 [Acer saccharum]|nr:hypothetical protein Q3G72_001098 [Acer saccharum]